MRITDVAITGIGQKMDQRSVIERIGIGDSVQQNSGKKCGCLILFFSERANQQKKCNALPGIAVELITGSNPGLVQKTGGFGTDQIPDFRCDLLLRIRIMGPAGPKLLFTALFQCEVISPGRCFKTRPA